MAVGQQHLRGEVVEQPPVGGSLGVMELINDDDVVGVGRHGGDVTGMEGLDAGVDMPPVLRFVTADQQLAERAVAEGLAEGAAGLGEDPLAVRHEEEAEVSTLLLPQPPVVQGGHDGLAGAGGGDDEAAPAVVDLPFSVDGVEDLLLVSPRPQLESAEELRVVCRVTSTAGEGVDQPLAVLLGVVTAVVTGGPLGVEGGSNLLEQRWAGGA